LTSGVGSRTVWAQWKDGAQNWSNPISTTIVVDTTKPTASVPHIGFATGGTATVGGSVPVKLTWTGADDGSGVHHYDVAMSRDGGTYASLGSVTTPAITKTIAGGHSYRFRIRAVDAAGNIGSWVESPVVRRSIIDDDRSIAYSGTWRRVTSIACIGGTQRTSRDAGASARTTITGRAAAYIATIGPGYGKAKVYLDGAYVATVDLGASSTVSRKVVWSTRWSSVGTHMVRIKVVGPDGGPKVSLDAVAVLK
jgi:hypothetical protein